MRPACAATITFLNVGLPVGAEVHEPSRRRAENRALPRSPPTVSHVVFAGSKSCIERYGNVRPGDPSRLAARTGSTPPAWKTAVPTRPKPYNVMSLIGVQACP